MRIAEKLGQNQDVGGGAGSGEQDGSSVVRHCLDQMTARIGGDGGAIAIDTKGRIAIEWNSVRMAWAYTILDSTAAAATSTTIADFIIEVHFGCNANEHFIEHLHLTES